MDNPLRSVPLAVAVPWPLAVALRPLATSAMMTSVPTGTWCFASRRLLTTMTSVNSPVAAAAALSPSLAVAPPARPGFVLGDLEADQARCVLVPIYVEVLLSEGPDVRHVVVGVRARRPCDGRSLSAVPE